MVIFLMEKMGGYKRIREIFIENIMKKISSNIKEKQII